MADRVRPHAERRSMREQTEADVNQAHQEQEPDASLPARMFPTTPEHGRAEQTAPGDRHVEPGIPARLEYSQGQLGMEMNEKGQDRGEASEEE